MKKVILVSILLIISILPMSAYAVGEGIFDTYGSNIPAAINDENITTGITLNGSNNFDIVFTNPLNLTYSFYTYAKGTGTLYFDAYDIQGNLIKTLIRSLDTNIPGSQDGSNTTMEAYGVKTLKVRATGSIILYELDSTGNEALRVVSVTPANGATNIALDANVQVNFNKSVTYTSANISIVGVTSVLTGTQYVTINPVTDLQQNKEYTVRITGVNSGSETLVGTYEYKFRTGILLAAPVVSVVPSFGKAAVTWDTVPNANSYKIYLDNVLKYTVGAGVLSTELTGLTQGKQYKVTVEALGSSFLPSKTDYNFMTKQLTQTTMTVDSGLNFITVAWNAVTDAETYKIMLNGVVQAVKTGADTLSHTITGLLHSTPYQVSILLEAEGASLMSEIMTVNTLSMGSTVITATPTVNRISLSWTAVPEAATYRVYLNNTLKVTLNSNIRNYIIEGLNGKTNYNVKVLSYHADDMNYTETAIAVTTLDYFSSKPTAGNVDVTEYTAKVKWNSVQDTKRYEIKLNEDGEVFSTTDLYYQFNNLEMNTDYTAYVRQVNLIDTVSEWTVIPFRTLTRPEVPPPKPADLFLISKGMDFIEVRVTETQWATSYNFYLNNTLKINQSGTTYRFTGLTKNTQYSVSVRAVNEYGQSMTPVGMLVRTDSEPVPTVSNASSSFSGGSPMKQDVKWTSSNVTQGFKILVDGLEVGTYPANTSQATIDFDLLGLPEGEHVIEVIPLDPNGRSYKFKTIGKSTGNVDLDKLTGDILFGKDVIFSGGKYLLYILVGLALLFITINFIYNKMKLNLATTDHAQLEADPDLALKTENKTSIDKENQKNAVQEESNYYKIKKEDNAQKNEVIGKLREHLAAALSGKKEKTYLLKEPGQNTGRRVSKQEFLNTKYKEFKSLKTEGDFSVWQKRFNDFSESRFNKFYKNQSVRGKKSK